MWAILLFIANFVFNVMSGGTLVLGIPLLIGLVESGLFVFVHDSLCEEKIDYYQPENSKKGYERTYISCKTMLEC